MLALHAKKFCHRVQVVLCPCQTYREFTIAKQVLFHTQCRTLPLTGDKLTLMLGIFTACWRGMPGAHFLLQNNFRFM